MVFKPWCEKSAAQDAPMEPQPITATVLMEETCGEVIVDVVGVRFVGIPCVAVLCRGDMEKKLWKSRHVVSVVVIHEVGGGWWVSQRSGAGSHKNGSLGKEWMSTADQNDKFGKDSNFADSTRTCFLKKILRARSSSNTALAAATRIWVAEPPNNHGVLGSRY